MKYELKKLPKSEVELIVEVSEEAMKPFMKRAADEISKNVKVKGFRPGHVPAHVLEQYVEPQYILHRAQEFAMQQFYSEIVVKEKIDIVSRPKVKVDSDEPFKFTATVPVMPEVEIKDHASIKIKKEEVKVSKDDIEKVVEDLKKYGTSYKDVEREAKLKDRAEIDFEGFDKDGKTVPNTKSQNHPVILGEGSLIPGFEEEIEGMKVGETKEFDIKFPKDYGKEDFQGKKLKFKVTLQRLEAPTIPEFDDALIEKMTGRKQTVEEFKKETEKNILARKEQEALQKRENEYVEALLKKIKVEISDLLIEQEAYAILQDVKADLERRKQEWGEFLEKAGTTEADLVGKYKKEAERRLKVRLALQYVIKEEKIEVSEKDLKDELEKMKSMYPDAEAEKIEKEFNEGGLRNQIANRLSLSKLFDKVLS